MKIEKFITDGVKKINENYMNNLETDDRKIADSLLKVTEKNIELQRTLSRIHDLINQAMDPEISGQEQDTIFNCIRLISDIK